MTGQILVVIGGVFTGFAVIVGLVVLGWRAKSPLVLRPVIKFSRSVVNPRQLRTAGTAASTTAVIRHIGRKSGRSYETPLDAVPIDGGFLIALPYGRQTNWLRNVLASGSATILKEGSSYAVTRPELVTMTEVLDHFSPADQRGFRLLNIDECLSIRTVGQPD